MSLLVPPSTGRLSPMSPDHPPIRRPVPAGPALAIDVQSLEVVLSAPEGGIRLLRGVNLAVEEGATTCIVGPSGSGKSLLTRAILGILPGRPGVVAGHIRIKLPHGGFVEPLAGLRDVNLTGDAGAHAPLAQFQSWYRTVFARYMPLWGSAVAFVPQHGQRALDPTRSVGTLLTEAILARRRDPHLPLSSANPRQEALEWLERLRISGAGRVLGQRPSSLSGGMAQRVSIAVALARGAHIVLADEPTAGLDDDACRELLRLLKELRDTQLLRTLLIITHDFGLVDALAQNVAVMYQGRIVEQAPAHTFSAVTTPPTSGPKHPVSQRLLLGYRRLEQLVARSGVTGAPRDSLQAPCLTVRGLTFGFRPSQNGLSSIFHRLNPSPPVLHDLNLELYPGQVLGLMGQSGAGKSTLADCLIGRLMPQQGSIRLDGLELTQLPPNLRRERWRLIQLLHQSVEAALHPQMSVEQGLMETCTQLLRLPGAQALARVTEVLTQIQLGHRSQARPATLSGGELRRVGLARALLVRPRVLIADEPTAGIDASLRADILDLLLSMTRGPSPTAILLISHDLHALRYAADQLLMLEGGRILPLAPFQELPSAAASNSPLLRGEPL